jgi:ferredoxin-NADP reductase
MISSKTLLYRSQLTRLVTDYLHLTKRFGIVAASQLPLHYLLAFKSPFSPIQLLTGCSHETLNIYHQLLGRIIIFLFQLHAAFYLNFFIQSNLLAAKVKELYIICGILGAIIFTTIGTTALAPVRRWSYRVFYATHVILAVAWMPVLFFHVAHIRLYLYETATLFAINVVLRHLHSRTVTGAMSLVTNTNLVEIDIPITNESRQLGRFVPGQHAYLSLAGHPASRTFRSNPFSVSSIPSSDGSIRFCARILDGNTTLLARKASATNSKHQFTIEGPYGVRDHADKLLQYDSVLFVAGGVGATFIIPLYRQLLADLSPSRGSHRRQKVSFVWVAKSMADTKWALLEDPRENEGFVERLKVYVTRASSGDELSGPLRSDDRSEDANAGYTETEEGIEMQEQEGLLSRDANGSVDQKGGSKVAAYAGRPDLKRLVDQAFSRANSERVAVFVCGPKSLSQRLRGEIGRWVSRGQDVWFWEEAFAL